MFLKLLGNKVEIYHTHPSLVCGRWAMPNFEQRKVVVTIFSVCRSFTYAMSPIPGEVRSQPFSPMIIRFFNGRLLLNLNDLDCNTKYRFRDRLHGKYYLAVECQLVLKKNLWKIILYEITWRKFRPWLLISDRFSVNNQRRSQQQRV